MGRRPKLPWDEGLDNEPSLREALDRIARPRAPKSAWSTVWERLIHQYDIDHTGILALPLLVEMAGTFGPKQRFQHICLVGSIAFCSQLGMSRWVLDAAPGPIRQAFDRGKEKAIGLLLETMHEPWGIYETKALVESYAALRGHARLAEQIDWFEVVLCCPKCGHDFERMSHVVD